MPGFEARFLFDLEVMTNGLLEVQLELLEASRRCEGLAVLPDGEGDSVLLWRLSGAERFRTAKELILSSPPFRARRCGAWEGGLSLACGREAPLLQLRLPRQVRGGRAPTALLGGRWLQVGRV